MKTKFISALLAVSFTFLCLLFPVSAQNTTREEQRILEIAQGIIDWKRQDNGVNPTENLINEAFLELAGTTAGDWFPIGLARLGLEDNYDSYLAALTENVQNRYREPGKLSAAKATEWHRISLAFLAAGADPTRVGKGENGQPIDLIADGTYNRGKTTSLGRQGIKGWIWGLIALDSKRYTIPEGSANTRDDILVEIMSQQLIDGGFSLGEDHSDPDVTAMAVQAMAPYYNSETRYTYQQTAVNQQITKTVRQVVDECLAWLSQAQLETGDFESMGIPNVESTNQVAVALCSLNIDPLTDERFVKNSNTLLDGILRYRAKSGGFIHSFSKDSTAPTGEANAMASDQALYTMAALWRQKNGLRPLYDFRPERSLELRERIAALEEQLCSVSSLTSRSELELLLSQFYSLPVNERAGVRGYWTLSDSARKSGVDIEAIARNTAVISSPDDTQEETAVLIFSAQDKALAASLPEVLTTEHTMLIVKLLDKLERSEDFEEKAALHERLASAKSQVLKIQVEIESINADILQNLYPLQSISWKDKPVIDTITARYNALSDYDRSKIEHWEDVVRAKTAADNQWRAIVIACALLVLVAVSGAMLLLRFKKRRRRKQDEMEELAAQYENEDE